MSPKVNVRASQELAGNTAITTADDGIILPRDLGKDKSVACP
jgi:hypothetical protein